jgi:mercuric ion transport protein
MILAPKAEPGSSTRLLASGGVLGATLGMSCCILPFALVSLGLGGAWLSWLTALAPYEPIILAATVALLGVGFWRIYGPAAQAQCAADGACATHRASVGTKLALWLAAALVAATFGINLIL